MHLLSVSQAFLSTCAPADFTKIMLARRAQLDEDGDLNMCFSLFTRLDKRALAARAGRM
jgi:hypothetical protein